MLFSCVVVDFCSGVASEPADPLFVRGLNPDCLKNILKEGLGLGFL